ncbi:MAG TPA: calcineurin-like phosphoesterase C-terminal domain-containing protein [Lunatimonas sp.]|nr:calcineurin-like phosphoesterase C-terminal domain-containing protein [Lunatimonas sp.]
MISYIKIGIVFLLLLNFPIATHAQETARGFVYQDLNKNGQKDSQEPGLPNVLVSNGQDVVATDANGRYELPISEGMGIFVIKPSGFSVPLNSHHLPQYYHWHNPKGTPATSVPSVAPTGVLPDQLNFALREQVEDDKFDVLLFGDPQARGIKEVNYVSHDVVEECIGTPAVFGITLGDIVADDPALFEEVSQSIAQIGIPWHYVFGNHDHNRDVTEDHDRDGTFKRIFGPSTYAFEYGQVSFIVLRDIHYSEDGRYSSRFTDEQLGFVQEYLDLVPEEKLVIVVQHAPLIRTEGRETLYRLLEKRPHTLSISGHTHTMNHIFVDEEMGWNGSTQHHHFINATVSGSWWCGLKDETGIPHATMNDGAPNGYTILSLDGAAYQLTFKAARRPADYQLNVYLKDDIARDSLANTPVIVNVFSGSQRSTVEMKVAGSEKWIPLDFTPMPDPYNEWMHSLSPYLDGRLEDGSRIDEPLGYKMDKPRSTSHIWSASLPAELTPGTHHILVRTTDMFGRVWTGKRIFRVH